APPRRNRVSGPRLFGTLATSGQEAQSSKLLGDLIDDALTACAAGAARGHAVEIADFVEDQAAKKRIQRGLAQKDVEHAIPPASVRVRRQPDYDTGELRSQTPKCGRAVKIAGRVED